MEKAEFMSALYEGAQAMSLEISDSAADKLYALYLLMLDENTRQNLTRITEPREAAEKHMLDSLTVLPYLKKGMRVADIGCGAGFPTLPLGIAAPDVSFIGVDSTEKRIRYVNGAAKELSLNNVSAIAARAEELGKKDIYRESFDLVTARAVAALPVLCEYCLPLVKVGGTFVAMKANADDELAASKKAISLLGGELCECKKIKLPISQSERTLIIVNKIKNTPAAYPRAGGAIAKKPL